MCMVSRERFEGIAMGDAFLDTRTMVDRLEVSTIALEVVHHKGWLACIPSIANKDRWAMGNTFIFKFI